jgi:hypothetical protein
MLEREFAYYRKHQPELVRDHLGEYVVIRGDKIIGFYRSEAEAFEETAKEYEPGSYLIEPCIAGTAHYTAVFNSRARFASPT